MSVSGHFTAASLCEHKHQCKADRKRLPFYDRDNFSDTLAVLSWQFLRSRADCISIDTI